MRLFRAALVSALLLLASVANAGLVVSEVASAPTGPSVRIQQVNQDTGGTTSIRYYSERVGLPDKTDTIENAPNPSYYYTRDRDLGQTFTIGSAGFHLGAITVRVQGSASAVTTSALGAAVSLQLFELTGTPVINNNGSPPKSTTQWETFNPTALATDDYFTGLTFTHVAHITGGTIPVSTTQNDFLRWQATGTDRHYLEPNKRYALLFMFDEPGPQRQLGLANRNRASNPGQTDPYTGGFGIRREGKGDEQDRAAIFVHDLNDAADVEASRQSAMFDTNLANRLAKQPHTVGYPDNDTYRDLRFYLEAAPADYSLTATKDAYVEGGAASDTVQLNSRLGVRTDNSRKAWTAFNLSSVPANEMVTAATLLLTAQDTLTNFIAGSTFEVYGLTDNALDNWSETSLTFNNAPGNASHPWQLNSANTLLLGSTPVTTLATNQTVAITLDPAFFNSSALANDIATLIIVMRSTDTTTGRSTGWFYSLQSGSGSPPTLELFTAVPEPATWCLAGLGLSVLLMRGKFFRRNTLEGQR